ncbi:MAG: hypothetical protein FJX52_03300 [Alphaproteobacteria bacterium]|nr:hypothetical protein [Alphaproteobacteria bacterium]
MTQLTVRKVDKNVVQRLRLRAKHNERSLEPELRVILSSAALEDPAERQAGWAEIDRLRKHVRRCLKGRVLDDSTDFIRAARDSRARR